MLEQLMMAVVFDVCCKHLKEFFFFAETALQHVSMLFRSEPQWDVIEPLPEIGMKSRSVYIVFRLGKISEVRVNMIIER